MQAFAFVSAKAVLVRKIDGLSERANQRLPCAKGAGTEGD